MSFLFKKVSMDMCNFLPEHPPITDEILKKVAWSGDKFYVMSTNGEGYLSPDGSYSGDDGVNTLMAHQWLGEELPDASVLEGYVLRKVRNQPGKSRRKPLRFDPRQYRAFPYRPRLFFKHDYVLYMHPWYLKGKDHNYTHTHNVEEATRCSVEQAAYIAYHGVGAAAGYMPVLYGTATSQKPPYKFVDVRRLPSSPDRRSWYSNPYTWVKNKQKFGRFEKYVQKDIIYSDTRSYKQRLFDYILGRKLLNPYTARNQERIT